VDDGLCKLNELLLDELKFLYFAGMDKTLTTHHVIASAIQIPQALC
jgi:hypothetical protein